MKVGKRGFLFRGVRYKVLFVLVSILFVASILLQPYAASAASLTALSDTMSRLKASTASNHTIKFTTTASGVAAGQTMTVVFPAGFTATSVLWSDIDVSWGASTGAENELTLAATPTGATWGAAFSSQTLTITSGSGAITAASKVIIEIGTNATSQSTGVNQITNHATPATYAISLTAGPSDSGKLAIVVLADDQVQLTANVNPSITFSLSANSSAFGDLSTGSIVTAGTAITLTIGTNAQSGYTISVFDAGSGANPGLYNANATYLIKSADSSYGNTAALSAGTEGYGIQATQTGGASIDSRFSQGGDTVGGLETTAIPLATYSSGMSANHTVIVNHKAAISSWTLAGAYSDTITYLATGNF